MNINTLTFDEFKNFLDSRVEQYNTPDFIELDPISIPHTYSKKEDIEISGLLASIIAWGNRKMIVKNARRMMELMGNEPYRFIMQYGKSDMEQLQNFCHRTFNGCDLQFFVESLRKIYTEYGGLEKLFSEPIQNGFTTKEAIMNFRNVLLSDEYPSRVSRHISNPMANSACKRLNMYLKWMVRDDGKGVDFGIWKKFGTKHLICPLDVHTGRIGRKLNFITRNQDDWKSAEELTSNLRKFDTEDPVKYDYALFGLGIFEQFAG